jgi:urocanate hydratase
VPRCWRSNASLRVSRCGCAPVTSIARRAIWRTRSNKFAKLCKQEAGIDRLLGNAAEILPLLVERGVRPDMVTDQTSAHDLVYGYLPAGWSIAQWQTAQRDPSQHAALTAAAKRSITAHVNAMLAFHAQGIPTFDYGNNIRQVARDEGVVNAFAFRALFPPIFGHCFARAKDRFAGWRFRGIPRTFTRPIAR